MSLVKWFGPSDLSGNCWKTRSSTVAAQVDYPPMGGDANGIEEEEAGCVLRSQVGGLTRQLGSRFPAQNSR